MSSDGSYKRCTGKVGACSIDSRDSEQNKRQQEAGVEANLMSKKVATSFSHHGLVLATLSRAGAKGGSESKQGVSPVKAKGPGLGEFGLALHTMRVCQIHVVS